MDELIGDRADSELRDIRDQSVRLWLDGNITTELLEHLMEERKKLLEDGDLSEFGDDRFVTTKKGEDLMG